MKIYEGLSKLSKESKINMIRMHYLDPKEKDPKPFLQSFWHADKDVQKILDAFSENTISNFFIPYGVVPNFLLNDQNHCIPMAVEESSVVAAASKSAKFWFTRGGFQSHVIDTEKNGQVHLIWRIDPVLAERFFLDIYKELLHLILPLFSNMKKRGGGLKSLRLKDCTPYEDHYFQICLTCHTSNAMGANLVNTALERIGDIFKRMVRSSLELSSEQKNISIIMSILSNYTPHCLVQSQVSCRTEELNDLSPEFSQRCARAIRISKFDRSRAVTHNKGIMNGVDALALATGNDFRAIEADCHAFAARTGTYQGLTSLSLEKGQFTLSLTLPISIGTIGGVTSLHPMAAFSLKLLRNPNAKQLMMFMCSLGLAQNFAALTALITGGIQRGHMKMHLNNILKQLKVSEHDSVKVREYFKDTPISFKSVKDYIDALRDL